LSKKSIKKSAHTLIIFRNTLILFLNSIITFLNFRQKYIFFLENLKQSYTTPVLKICAILLSEKKIDFQAILDNLEYEFYLQT